MILTSIVNNSVDFHLTSIEPGKCKVTIIGPQLFNNKYYMFYFLLKIVKQRQILSRNATGQYLSYSPVA